MAYARNNPISLTTVLLLAAAGVGTVVVAKKVKEKFSKELVAVDATKSTGVPEVIAAPAVAPEIFIDTRSHNEWTGKNVVPGLKKGHYKRDLWQAEPVASWQQGQRIVKFQPAALPSAKAAAYWSKKELAATPNSVYRPINVLPPGVASSSWQVARPNVSWDGIPLWTKLVGGGAIAWVLFF